MSKKLAPKRLRKLIRREVAATSHEPAPIAAHTMPAASPGGGQSIAPPPPIEGPARAMVIVAHPDDAEFLCAGTIARWCAEGWDVTYVVVTSGDKGTHDPTMHPEKLAAIREAEQRDACRVLGVRECVFLAYPDGFLVDDHELRGQLVRLIRLHRPDVVITWDGFRSSFNHRDHRIVGISTADAIFPTVRDRLYYAADEADGLDSIAVNEILFAGASDPDYIVDVTAHWDTKVDAILCHTSQIGGRTRDDFLKQRQDVEAQNPGQPIEEKFRRWSIRRPEPKPKEAEAANG